MAAEEVERPSVPTAPAAAPGERPFQFGTRSLLALMAATCLLFAISRWFGAVWAITLVWFGVLVAAHIAANFWGKRNFRPQSSADETVPAERPLERFPEADQATVRQLQADASERISRIRLGWTTVGVTALGVLLGCAAGAGIGMACFNLEEAKGMNGLVVAAVSAGVLGGFLGFWCASFVHVFYAYNVAGWEGAAARPAPRPPAKG